VKEEEIPIIKEMSKEESLIKKEEEVKSPTP